MSRSDVWPLEVWSHLPPRAAHPHIAPSGFKRALPGLVDGGPRHCMGGGSVSRLFAASGDGAAPPGPCVAAHTRGCRDRSRLCVARKQPGASDTELASVGPRGCWIWASSRGIGQRPCKNPQLKSTSLFGLCRSSPIPGRGACRPTRRRQPHEASVSLSCARGGPSCLSLLSTGSALLLP